MVTKGVDSKRYLRLKQPLRVHGRDDGIVDAWLYDGDGFIMFSTFCTAMHTNHLIMAKVLELVRVDVKMACDYPKADDGMSFFGVAKKLIKFSDIPTIVKFMINEIGTVSANTSRLYAAERWNVEDIISQFDVERLMLNNPGPDTKSTKKKRKKNNNNDIDLVDSNGPQESNQSIFDNEEEEEEEEEDDDEYQNKYEEKRSRRSFPGAKDTKVPDSSPPPPPQEEVVMQLPVSAVSLDVFEPIFEMFRYLHKDISTSVAQSKELMGPFCFNNFRKTDEFKNLVQAEVEKEAKTKEKDLEDIKRDMEIQLRSRIESELVAKVLAQHKAALDTNFDNQAAQLRVLRHTAEFEAKRLTQEAQALKSEFEKRFVVLEEREKRASEKLKEAEAKLSEAHQLNKKAFVDFNNYL